MMEQDARPGFGGNWMEGQYSRFEVAARDLCLSVGIDPDECPFAGLKFADNPDKPWWKYYAEELATTVLNISVLRRHGLLEG